MTLKREVERTRRPKVAQESCISQATWQLEYRQAALQRAGRARAREVWKAWRDFQRVLHEDRRQWVQVAGEKIKELLETGRVKEAWDHLARLYRQVRGR